MNATQDVCDSSSGIGATTDSVGASYAKSDPGPVTAMIPSVTPPSPLIIQPSIAPQVSVTLVTATATQPATTVAPTTTPSNPAGGYAYTSSQQNASWLGNFWNALWSPSSYGIASNVTPSDNVQAWETGSRDVAIVALSAATGGVAAQGAVAVLGEGVLSTWGGTAAVGMFSGGVAAGTQNVATQLGSNQPFSVSSLVTSIDEGAVFGGAGGLAGKALVNILSGSGIMGSTAGAGASEASTSARTGATAATSTATDNTAINAGEVTTYQEFVDRSVVGDNLEGHELWQNANLKAQGLAPTRLSTLASQNNPVLALDSIIHASVNYAQQVIDAASQTPIENINTNAMILRLLDAAPEDAVRQLQQMAIQHAQSYGY